MGFHEVQFPVGISYGSRGGPSYSTHVIELDSGNEQRVGNWSQPRHVFDAAYGVKEHTDLMALREFYIARRGPLNGFRYKDWHDFSTATDHVGAVDDEDETIGTGDGTTTTFQLVKRYTSGSETRVRNIHKPVSGTTTVALDGVNQASGWSVDTTTGIVTFTTAPLSTVVVSAGFQFDVPVRFAKELDNGLLTTYSNYGSGDVRGGIPIIEVFDGTAVPDEFYYGGASPAEAPYQPMAADITISLLSGRVIVLDPQSNNLKVNLPDPTTMPAGAEHFYISNINGSNQIKVHRKVAGGVLQTLNPNTVLICFIGLTGAGTQRWHSIAG